MLGYGVGFLIISITNFVLQLSEKINAVPPIIATSLIAVLSLYTWWNLKKKTETNK